MFHLILCWLWIACISSFPVSDIAFNRSLSGLVLEDASSHTSTLTEPEKDSRAILEQVLKTDSEKKKRQSSVLNWVKDAWNGVKQWADDSAQVMEDAYQPKRINAFVSRPSSSHRRSIVCEQQLNQRSKKGPPCRGADRRRLVQASPHNEITTVQLYQYLDSKSKGKQQKTASTVHSNESKKLDAQVRLKQPVQSDAPKKTEPAREIDLSNSLAKIPLYDIKYKIDYDASFLDPISTIKKYYAPAFLQSLQVEIQDPESEYSTALSAGWKEMSALFWRDIGILEQQFKKPLEPCTLDFMAKYGEYPDIIALSVLNHAINHSSETSLKAIAKDVVAFLSAELVFPEHDVDLVTLCSNQVVYFLDKNMQCKDDETAEEFMFDMDDV